MKKKVQLTISIILFIICLLSLIISIIYKKVIYKKIDITAHRGDNISYPENSMNAFISAYEKGVDWIELDVRQTKDGKIIVFHDNNLKRLTGYDGEIIDTLYDTISSLKLSNNDNEYIPLFENVLSYFSDKNIKLNIEIKITGKEKYFESDIISLINKYNMKSKCYLASSSYNSLKKVKDIDDSINTIYVINKISKNISNYDKADIYSVYYKELTKDIVSSIHAINKKVFVWNIDNLDDLKTILKYDVDNIITNDINMVKNYIR